ncbi:MAG TPA: 50S ribosomal protein L4 [Dissulfurispiraceae bacterium]|nr:50S ribosomal protein L4 [Dissulfurispiraceae bacterium]
MLEIDIKDGNNSIKGKVTLAEEIFGSTASDSVVHAAVVGYLANMRQGTHSTKTRSMVSGGGKKPWKQKHTGRARHGSTRSPVWRGGGIAFGPAPRDYTQRLPRNLRRVALCKALSMKFSDGEVGVIESITIEKPKTKSVVQILGNLGLQDRTVLFVTPERDENLMLSVRNIPKADIVRVSDLNALHVASYDTLLFTAEALRKLQERVAGQEDITS